MCQEVWPSAESRQHYSMALMSLQYLAPSCVLLYTYARIAVVIWVKRTPGEAENSRDRRFARAKRKVSLDLKVGGKPAEARRSVHAAPRG